MTKKEAIQVIKNNLPTNGTYETLTEALVIAIEVLERSVGEKSWYRADIEHCPVCSTEVGGENYEDNFCRYCGQKIEWSE